MDVLKTVSKQDVLNKCTLISTMIGVVIGVFASFIVNATLVEISINSFFSLYYGIIFTAIGCFLIYRTQFHESASTSTELQNRKPIIMFFASLTLLSGIISILLDKNWFMKIGPTMKIPMYMVLGSSICFTLVFAGVDIINFVGGYIRRLNYRSLVDASSQIVVLSVISLAMGGIYGLIFGWNDVEDGNEFAIQIKMMREEKYCFIIGVILGGAGGIISELLRRNVVQPFFMKVEKDPFSEEI